MNTIKQSNRGSWSKGKEFKGVIKRGRNFTIRYTVNGKVRWESVGPSRATAVKMLQKRKTEILEGKFFPALRRRHVSYDEIIKDAVEDTKAKFEKDHPGETFKPNRYTTVAPWFAGRLAASVTAKEIEDKINDHAKTDASFNRLRVAISHSYKLATKNRKVAENPGADVKMRKEDNERVRWLEPEEEAAIRAAIQKLCPEREPEFTLAVKTGMRWSEQYRKLVWSNVNLKLRVITIPKTKHGKTRRIQLHPDAVTALQKLKALAGDSPFVCHSHGREHRNWWGGVLKEAKVTNFHWHDCRHDFASQLVMNGVDILTVKELMGHKTISVTMRYAHLAPSHLQTAVDRLPSVAISVAASERVNATIN